VNEVSSLESVVVLRKAELAVTQIVNPALVSRGQTNIPVDISVTNVGEAAANINDISFSFIGKYTINDIYPPYPDILPGDTVTYNFLFDVSLSSGTGTDVIDVDITGKDSISSNVVMTDSSFTWVIEGESNVEILSVIPSQSPVSQGQAGIPVSVILRNQVGGSSVLIDTVTLRFNNGDSNYTNIVAVVEDTLSAGETDTVGLNVSVNTDAPTGSDIINASAVGRDLTTSDPVIISVANTPGNWTVQQRPLVSSPVLSINADTVSTGQSGLLLNFQVSNAGGATPTATAEVDSINLVINGLESDSSQFSYQAQFATPFSLVNNTNLPLNYTIDVGATALSGAYGFEAKVYYRDINDSLQQPAVLSVSDSLLVQQAGSLVIDSVRSPVLSASVGQTGIPVAVYFRNPGEAGVDVTGASLRFNGVTTGFFQSLDSLADSSSFFTGSNVAYFTIEVLGSAVPGNYTVTSQVDGVEANSGLAVSDVSTGAEGYVLTVTQPGQLRLLSVSTDFDSVSIGSQGVGVRARIRNSSSSTVLVDSLKLTFSSGSYLRTDTTITPALVLGANESSPINFAVDVPGSNVPGIATLNGQVFGRDSVSGSPLSDLGADTTDVWRLVTAAQLSFVSIAPDSLSNGQLTGFSVLVNNGGQATVAYGDSVTFLDFNGTQIFSTQSGLISGGGNTLLSFASSVISQPVGLVNGSLEITDFTENGFQKDTTLSPVSITVFDSALLVLNSVTGADTVSQDMNLDLAIQLTNSGAVNANALIDVLA
jgi:hypothetical protein